MEIVLQVLKDYWKVIVVIFVLILSFILQLVKKKPIKFVDTLKTSILQWLPGFIINAESTGLKGENKVMYVLHGIYDLLFKSSGVSFDYFMQTYEAFIRSQLEAILKTPTSHKEVR